MICVPDPRTRERERERESKSERVVEGLFFSKTFFSFLTDHHPSEPEPEPEPGFWHSVGRPFIVLSGIIVALFVGTFGMVGVGLVGV